MTGHFLYRRREFIALLGGAAAAWPLVARAQQGERMRRIGALIRLRRGRSRLRGRWWGSCRNCRNWVDRGPQYTDRFPLELGRCRAHSQVRGGIRRACAGRHRWLLALRRWAVATGDPRCADCVRECPRPGRRRLFDSLARPGGNATGFILFEYGLSGKWLELLKQIAPSVKRVAVFRDPP